MRVISGKYRNSKLLRPPSEITRPTTDRVREAVFSAIQFKVENSIFLDLCAGSGSLSIEAISRGATKAILVEWNREAIKVINSNFSKLNINNYELFSEDVIKYLKHAKNIKFDFIFLDPPYKNWALGFECLKLIKANDLLKKYGNIILKLDSPDITLPKGLVVQKLRIYGTAYIFFISNNI